MRYGKWLAAAVTAAVFFLPSQIMAAANRCTCEDNGGTCKCDRTAEQILEEWENRCRCAVPTDLDYNRTDKNQSEKNGTYGDSVEEDGATAEQNKKDRFIEILRDDSFIYYMDRLTARYLNVPHMSKEKMIDVWIKLEPVEYAEGDYTFPAKYYLEHYLIRPKRQKIQFLAELEVTRRPNNDMQNKEYDGSRWEILVPGSIEDSIYHAVLKHKSEIHDESSSDGTSIRDYIENTINVSL